MNLIKQICEHCRYKLTSQANFPCVDCSSRDRWEVAETITVSSRDIQALQQYVTALERQADVEGQQKLIQALQQENEKKDDTVEQLTVDRSTAEQIIQEQQQQIEQLQAQLTYITKIRDDYATAARVIALYLVDFCDNSMPYDKMIADAARKACMAVEKLQAQNGAMREALKLAESRFKIIEQATEYVKPGTGVWHTVGIALSEIDKAIAAIDKIGGR